MWIEYKLDKEFTDSKSNIILYVLLRKHIFRCIIALFKKSKILHEIMRVNKTLMTVSVSLSHVVSLVQIILNVNCKR